MFKAFTDNISSLIGGKEKESEEKATSDEGVTNDEVSTGGTQPSTETDDATSEEKVGSKVPPPRPAPPLTPASSVCKPDTPPPSPTKSTPTTGDDGAAETPDADTDAGTKKDKMDEKLEQVTEKAKAWGSYLFSVTKAAGASVSSRAKDLKKAVQDNTIIGDFVKEQDKFVTEKKERARANEAAVPPWVGYNEEEQMKQQMLSLSNDKRNFLRNPPSGVQFHFDYETCYPVAMATLAEDDKLQKMRFDLVPKLATEHDFWRNYFYRVSLIKQSTQLTSLAKQSSSSSITDSSEQVSSKAEPQGSSVVDASASAKQAAGDETGGDTAEVSDDVDINAAQDEFVSDAYNLEISDEDLIKEMEALRASPGADGEWEFEVVGADSNDLEIDEAALEREIMDEMNKSSEDLK